MNVLLTKDWDLARNSAQIVLDHFHVVANQATLCMVLHAVVRAFSDAKYCSNWYVIFNFLLLCIYLSFVFYIESAWNVLC